MTFKKGILHGWVAVVLLHVRDPPPTMLPGVDEKRGDDGTLASGVRGDCGIDAWPSGGNAAASPTTPGGSKSPARARRRRARRESVATYNVSLGVQPHHAVSSWRKRQIRTHNAMITNAGSEVNEEVKKHEEWVDKNAKLTNRDATKVSSGHEKERREGKEEGRARGERVG